MTKMCTNGFGVSLDTGSFTTEKKFVSQNVREQTSILKVDRADETQNLAKSTKRLLCTCRSWGIPLKGASKAYLMGSRIHPLIPSKEEKRHHCQAHQNQVY